MSEREYLDKLIEEVTYRRESTEIGIRISTEMVKTMNRMTDILADILRELKLLRVTS